jgi:hypothetical protein
MFFGARLHLHALSRRALSWLQVPTTVFTPLEYGCIGLSEEAAIATLGADRIEVFLSKFTPLEWKIPEARSHDSAFAKVRACGLPSLDTVPWSVPLAVAAVG